MKKHTKRVLGLCGLAVVGVTTAVAASLPAPTTAAINAGSATDTVVVRVVSDTPDVNVGGIDNNSTVTSPTQTLVVDYSDGVNTITATLTYTNIKGQTDTYTFETQVVDYVGGTWSLPVNLSELVGDGGLQFGYGHYVFTVVGTGYNGVTDTDVLNFDYAATTGEDGGVDEDGNVIIDLEGGDDNAKEILVYDKDGNLIPCLTVVVPAGVTHATLPFADCGVPTGDYNIIINSLDGNGNVISSYIMNLSYTAPTEVAVPNTGNITAGLNISRTDYLITGLVVFGMIAMFGIVMVTKRKKSKK